MCASWRWISTGADDPYWLYRDSPSHPIEEILKVLEEFRKAAKIKHAGFSNWSQSRAEEAQLAADRRVFRVYRKSKHVESGETRHCASRSPRGGSLTSHLFAGISNMVSQHLHT
jgi:hypothetical protein